MERQKTRGWVLLPWNSTMELNGFSATKAAVGFSDWNGRLQASEKSYGLGRWWLNLSPFRMKVLIRVLEDENVS
jgi:hypothetical protein